jgi:NAD(P)-dependent dehydrogenase (short-subunit alcohol dehydrogenase family)
VALGTVLITGASTGIGEATAHHLNELGFDAVGAVRRPHDAERLRAETVKIERVRARVPATRSAGTPGGVVRWRRCCPIALWTGSSPAMSR